MKVECGFGLVTMEYKDYPLEVIYGYEYKDYYCGPDNIPTVITNSDDSFYVNYNSTNAESGFKITWKHIEGINCQGPQENPYYLQHYFLQIEFLGSPSFIRPHDNCIAILLNCFSYLL